jgi:hypothetical protein
MEKKFKLSSVSAFESCDSPNDKNMTRQILFKNHDIQSNENEGSPTHKDS